MAFNLGRVANALIFSLTTLFSSPAFDLFCSRFYFFFSLFFFVVSLIKSSHLFCSFRRFNRLSFLSMHSILLSLFFFPSFYFSFSFSSSSSCPPPPSPPPSSSSSSSFSFLFILRKWISSNVFRSLPPDSYSLTARLSLTVDNYYFYFKKGSEREILRDWEKEKETT